MHICVYIHLYGVYILRTHNLRKTNNFRRFVNTSEWRPRFKHHWGTSHRFVISLHSTEKKWPHSSPLNTLSPTECSIPFFCHIATQSPGAITTIWKCLFWQAHPRNERKKCVQEYEKGCEIRITCHSYIVSRNAAKCAPGHGKKPVNARVRRLAQDNIKQLPQFTG